MTGKNPNTRNDRISVLVLLIGFLRNKFNRWAIVTITVVLVGIYGYFLSFRDIRMFPLQQNFTVGFYDDSANGGHSEILRHSLSDSAIALDFQLKKGFLSPYVGVSIAPTRDSVINLAHYNQIRLTIAAQGITNINFSLFTRNPYFRQKGNSNDLNFYTLQEISPEKKQYTIDFNELNVPDWWRNLNHIAPQEKIQPDLKHVYNFNLGNAYAPVLNTTCSLHIYSISIVRDNSRLAIMLIISWLTFFILLLIIYHLRAWLKQKQVSITISYRSVEVEEEKQPAEDFIGYINRSFQEHELSLEQVSEHTGVTPRRIAHSIQETYNCNFKTYVNRIRINESKRLLRETDWPIGEIAFKVGFGNQSHFNRVFKSQTQQSPSQYRESVR
jgi:AraC-like DNA-binding protein